MHQDARPERATYSRLLRRPAARARDDLLVGVAYWYSMSFRQICLAGRALSRISCTGSSSFKNLVCRRHTSSCMPSSRDQVRSTKVAWLRAKFGPMVGGGPFFVSASVSATSNHKTSRARSETRRKSNPAARAEILIKAALQKPRMCLAPCYVEKTLLLARA